MRQTPLVFDVARGSQVDGPGLRTTVFFKGCPLRCVWCHNPESQHFSPEIAFFGDRCVGCWVCEEVCPNRAIDPDAAGRIRRSVCAVCGTCADACDSLALRRIGKRYSEDELVELILRDRTFFGVSGGGVTFSGGEPLVHLDFLGRLAPRLQEEGVQVAVETCGHFDYTRFRRELLPWVDCVLYDLKIMDPAAHRRLTGRGNERILANFAALAGEEGVVFGEEPRPRGERGRAPRRPSASRRRTVVIPRVPLVPGLTASGDNLAGIARFLRSLGVPHCELLPYNPSGLAKWRRLGRRPPRGVDEKPMPLAVEQRLRGEFERLLSAPRIEVKPSASGVAHGGPERLESVGA